MPVGGHIPPDILTPPDVGGGDAKHRVEYLIFMDIEENNQPGWRWVSYRREFFEAGDEG
jgi:hypothetical protein